VGLAVLAGVVRPAVAWAPSHRRRAEPRLADDTQVIRVGAVIFYGFHVPEAAERSQTPQTIRCQPTSFNVARALHQHHRQHLERRVASSITRNLVRDTTNVATVGSLLYRLKYGYAQFALRRLDRELAGQTYVRLGISRRRSSDYQESVYRYRFPGHGVRERDGRAVVVGCGRDVPPNLPNLYGDSTWGSTTAKVTTAPSRTTEGVQSIRGTVPRFPTGNALARGFRGTLSHRRSRGQERRPQSIHRSVALEQRHFNANFDYLSRTDQTLHDNPKVDSDGYSFSSHRSSRRKGNGPEALIRFDSFRSDTPISRTAAEPLHHRARLLVPASGRQLHGSADARLGTGDVRAPRPRRSKQQRLFVHGLSTSEFSSLRTRTRSTLMRRLTMRGWQLAAAAAAVLGLTVGLAAQNLTINGAGATFPDPIYQKWFAEYNKIHPNIQINYQAQGSGAGIRQLTAQTVFFGASDGPMTPDQLLAAPGRVLHFPTVLGSVVPIYNIPNVTAELKFTGPCSPTSSWQDHRWNDPAIVKINPGVTLPGMNITVVHRSDGSGTSYIWTDYLQKVSPEWKQKVGNATASTGPWARRRAERRRDRPREADARHDRLRGAGLCAAEQAGLRSRAEQRR
jgi:hypothetical protein